MPAVVIVHHEWDTERAALSPDEGGGHIIVLGDPPPALDSAALAGCCTAALGWRLGKEAAGTLLAEKVGLDMVVASAAAPAMVEAIHDSAGSAALDM